jgi:hypothetical protein
MQDRSAIRSNARWRRWRGEAGLAVPDGVRLVFQAAYTPEVQPAETLWTLVDEPVVNKHIPTLEALDENHLNAMRRSRQRARKDQKPSRLPLVAKNRQPEVITRKPYQSLTWLILLDANTTCLPRTLKKAFSIRS